MDWSRAKTILILSFLFLNLILGYLLWTREMRVNELAVDTEQIVEETNRLLVQRNIRVPGGIPKESPKLKEMTVKLSDTVRADELKRLPSPVHFDAFTEKLMPREIAVKMGIPRMDQYQYDPMASQNKVYVMNQLYGQLPMFDVRLELVEENGSIIGYRQKYAEVDTSGDSRDLKEQKVISAYAAIRSIAENYLPEGTTIADIRLGYHGLQFNSPTLYMVPYWRVVTQEGEMLYINAFSGGWDAPQEKPGQTPKP